MEGGGGQRKVDKLVLYACLTALLTLLTSSFLDYSSSYSPVKNHTSPNLMVLNLNVCDKLKTKTKQKNLIIKLKKQFRTPLN